MQKNIVVLVSGRGSNARNIDRYFRQIYGYGLEAVISTQENPELQAWTEDQKISWLQVDSNLQIDGMDLYEIPETKIADIIVLAGFLKLLPADFIRNTDVPIVNIHPALLPKHGGQGMYGAHVHEAVIAEGDSHSGITIHHVNEKYDDGKIILQVSLPIAPGETPESLAQKIHELEYEHYPKVIEDLLYP